MFASTPHGSIVRAIGVQAGGAAASMGGLSSVPVFPLHIHTRAHNDRSDHVTTSYIRALIHLQRNIYFKYIKDTYTHSHTQNDHKR